MTHDKRVTFSIVPKVDVGYHVTVVVHNTE